MSNQSLARLQQENDRLLSEWNRAAAECERLQAKLTGLRSRLQRCEQSAATPHDDRASALEHRLLEATAIATNSLLTIANFDQAVNTALQILGEALETNRVNLIENFDLSCNSLFPNWPALGYEWTSPRTLPQYGDLEAAQGSYEEIPGIFELLHQGHTASYRIEDAPELFRSAQMAIGVKATHLVPITVEGKWWGVLGIDDCHEAKRRSASELSALRIAADCIGSAIQQQRTQQALLQVEQARSQELERHNTELQQTLDRLTESEQRFQTLFDLSSEGFYYAEVNPPCPVSLPIEEQYDLLYRNIRVVKANPAFAAMYGIDDPDELVGLRNADVHVADSQKNAAFIRGTIANGYRFRNLETEEIDKQGRQHYFLNSGVYTIRDGYAIGAWCTQIDITELRETQQALLEAEQARVAELAKANEELQQRDRLLSVVAQITKDLLEAEDVDTAIPAALEAVREAANISRVGLMLERQNSATQRLQHCLEYELLAPGIFDHSAIGMMVMDNEDFQVLTQSLYAGQSIWRVINELPEPTRSQFERLNIKSTGVVPIFIEGQYIGCIGFDDCFTPRQWSQQEIDVLTAAAESIGAALHRKQLVDRLVEERIQAEQARSQELAKANEALKRSVDVLATETDLNQFIGHVLRLAAQQFDAPLAEYWQVTNPNIARIVGWWGHQQIHGFGQHHDHPAKEAGVQVPAYMLEERQFTDRRKHFVASFDHSVQPAQGEFLSDPGDWYEAFGVSWQLNLPLIVGETCFGVLNFWQPSDRPFTEQQIELGYALAQQVTLAIRLSQLAEEAKQAAIAREQEKAVQERAAELAKANEVLSRTSSRLAEQSDLSTFLGHIVLEAAAQLGADGGHLTFYDQQQETIFTAVLVEQGRLVSSPDFPPDMPISEVGFIQLIRETRKLRYFDLEADFEQDAHLLWQDVGEYHKRCNHLVGVAIPLFVGNEFLGHFGLAFTYKKVINEQNVELLQALANQAAFAIQLTRLAEAAKQAAIAREQEKAAQERAAELAKVNKALRRAATGLATTTNIEDILTVFLREAIAASGATAGAVLRRVEGTEFEFVAILQGNELFHGESLRTHPFASAMRERSRFDVTGHFAKIVQGEMTLWQDTQQSLNWFPEGADYHRAYGQCATWDIPFTLGTEVAGYLGLAFQTMESPSVVVAEAITALSSQVAVALELTRLAEEAKLAAIAREQEKAAQERAAELAKANAVLRGATDRLASEPSLEAFLGHILTEACREAIESGLISLYDEDQEQLLPVVSYGFNTDYLYSEQHPIPIAKFPIWSTLLRSKQPLILDMDEQSELFVEETLAWHRAQGHQGVVVTALMLGDRPLGVLGIASCSKVTFRDTDLELFQALAQQATLAIQLTQLAEEAKLAAIAREQEKAAQERAAELAKANDALRRGVERLAASGTLDAALDAFLLEAMSVTGAAAGVAMRRGNGSEFIMQALAQDGEVIKPFDPHSTEEHYRARTAVDPTGVMERIAAGEVVVVPVNDLESWFPEAAAYHKNLGHCIVWNFPFQVSGEVVGYLGLAFREEKLLNNVLRETVQALAHQASLALETTRLAEEAKQAAIAREQEKAAQERAAELAKANATLRRSLSWLAHERNLNQFLETVLLEIASTTQAEVAHLFVLQEPERMLKLTARVMNGVIHDRPTSNEPVLFSAPFSVEITPVFRYLEEQSPFLILDMAMLQPELIEMAWPDTIDWLQREGYKQAVCLALKTGDRSVGFFGLAFREPREFSQEERELVIALANQASLAILLIQLAEAAKLAAIAREQEKAAQEQAAELAKANESLRRSLRKLANERNLNAYLEHILREALQMLDSTIAQIFLYNSTTDTLSASVGVDQQGEFLPTPGLVNELQVANPFPANITGIWQRLLNHRGPIQLDLDRDADDFWPGMVEWHRSRGNQAILCVPMLMGDVPLGLLGLASTKRIEFTVSELEFTQALVQQATLAIQLTRLAEEAKQGAILEERNHIAREIHDTLAQDFVGILMQLQAVTRLLTSNPDQAQAHLTRASDLARTGLAEARRSVWVLRQDSTEYSNFAQLLNQLTEQLAISSPVQTQIQLQGTPYPLLPEAGMNLLRIAQEAITNVLRHANAQHIELHLIYTAHYVRLCIRDDGHGFDPQPLTRGFGLMGMQQRADLIGAHLHIHSSPTAGTLVEVLLPSASLHQTSSKNYG